MCRGGFRRSLARATMAPVWKRTPDAFSAVGHGGSTAGDHELRPLPSAHAVLASLALVLLLGGLPAARGQHGVQSIQPLPAVTDSDERFGIANVYPHPHWLTLARNAGMRWNRWEFRWSTIEARQGRFDWGGSDEVVEASRSAGLKVQGI